jgi:hypothetical protein
VIEKERKNDVKPSLFSLNWKREAVFFGAKIIAKLLSFSKSV